jgi:hypothetical protein
MFTLYLILPVALWPGADSASNRNEYKKVFLGGKARLAHKVDNVTDRKCETLNPSQTRLLV